jgi:xanthine dehydrogenase YagR molybdenum-binding subunit
MPEEILADPPKTKKVKTTVTVNGQEKEVEVEVPDIDVNWGSKKDRKNVGTRMPRLDGYDKVTGRAKYTYDRALPGMLHGKILRSPFPKARITTIDLAPAMAIPGVKAVVALKTPGSLLRFQGDEIACLAAETPEIAEDAIRAIKVTYDFMPFVVKPEDALKPDSPSAVGNDRPNYEKGNASERGDVAAGFQKATAVVENTYYASPRVHCCLETHGHVVFLEPNTGDLKVWSSTQAVHGTAEEFAGIAGIPKSKVELHGEHMGGGFGSKFGARMEGKAAYELSKASKRPVKLMLDRREEATAAGYAPSAQIDIKIGGNPDGTITALEAKGWGSGGLGGAGFPFPYLYNLGSQKIEKGTVRTNVQPSAAMRAPGHPQASFLMESAVDELACKLGVDPLEFRRKNDGFEIRQAEYKIGAEKIGWAQNFNKNPGKGGPILRGVGVAAATWGGGGGSPNMKAEVSIAPDGSVVVREGTQDIGTGVRTFITAIVADELGIDRSLIRSEVGSSLLPFSGGSGGSTTTPSVAPAVKMAAVQAKFDFLNTLAKATGEPIEKLTMLPGGSVSNGTKTLTWKEACKRLPIGGVTSQGAWASDLVQRNIGGVQFAHVEVDMETGRVRPIKIVAVQDCGIIMNPMTAESQVNGGIIQALGFALYEEQLYDRQTGRMVNPNLEEYKLPGSWDMPIIETIMYEPENAKGVSGMAESPVIPTAAAIANAVYNASGARVRALPMTPAKVLEALGKVAPREAKEKLA